MRVYVSQNAFPWIKNFPEIEKHQKCKYATFDRKMKKYDFGGLLSRGILAWGVSEIYMALWNYSNSETLSIILNGLEKVSKKSGSLFDRNAQELLETGLTLSLTSLVRREILTLFRVLSGISKFTPN